MNTHSDEQQRTARAVFGENAHRTHTTAKIAKDSDQKRALRGTAYAHAVLTPRQVVRVNAALAARRSPAALLSPRQNAVALGPS